MVLSSRMAIVLSAVLLVLLTGVTVQSLSTVSAASYSIDKVQSGLAASDSLTSGNTAGMTFGGTASIHDYFENSQGLNMGIRALQSGQWVNYYASLPQADARLYHAHVTISDAIVSDGVSNVGLYVEGSDFIPHVGCEAYADSTGHYWVVEQSSDAGATYNILYITQPNALPQAQDCTIITNGSNYLKVYIGGNLVFSSDTMNLGMSAPFIVFVQDDTSSSSSLHYAKYRNYYATTDENVQVINNPSNAATVKIVDSSGQVLASSPVTSGTATLDVGRYTFPLSGTIKVYDSSNSVITSSPATVYGGDAYSVTVLAETAPQPPTGLSSAAVSSSQINLSWSAPADNGGSPITGYKIERSAGGAFSVLVANTGSTGTTYPDTGLAANTMYTYRVSAITSVGTSLPSNTASATTTMTVPSQPLNLAAAAASSSQINLTWNAPSNNGGSPITGYKIERSTDNGSTWGVLVPNTGSISTTYSNIGLSPSTTYTYRVSAINSIGTSLPSNTASATTASVTAPSQPLNLAAAAASSSQINLTWNAPSNNGGSPITGYKIERSPNGGTTWDVIIPNTGSTGTTYSDAGLSPSTTYAYRVSAINIIGTSQPSISASATTNQQPIQPITLSTSGLVAFDPLNNETKTRQELEASQGFWHYGGSAFSYFNPPAPTDLFKNSDGLHVGVSPPVNATYAGYYGVTGPVDAKLFHAVITTPVRTISGDFFQNGLYVQTWDGRINYVTCVAITSTAGTSWHVVRTFGNFDQALSFQVLWSDASPNQPLTRDCTIITNGVNYLKMYIDGVNVYTNSTIDLQMPGPFLYFVEPQNSHAQMLYGVYKDFYMTKDETIALSNIPAGSSRVDVLDPSGNVLSTASVTNGNAVLDVGRYHFPIAANIKVYDSSNTVIASTSAISNMYGGDVYSVR
ncbi:MAG: fibronectin type III domain-containing protein [Candidatus Nitrosotenuis sp.]|nr:MAG: fibronectin type III domain-containing protein [Candidatus Nitrosotenuis sp.]